jgi:cell division protein FtsL
VLATKPLQTTPAIAWNKPVGLSGTSVKTEKKGTGERLKWIATILFCTTVVSLMISQFSAIARLNLEVENLQMQAEKQKEANSIMNNRVNELQSPSRIIAKAREMGMVSTNPGAVVKAGKE